MEVAGIVVGVAGLAGLFSTCVECFDYIQLGTTFGTDFGTCLLRLDGARLRLSRWSVSVGLAAVDSTGIQSPPHAAILISREDYEFAQRLLEQIRDAFAVAEKMSTSYQNQTTGSAQQPNLMTVSPLADLEPEILDASVKRVHMSLQQLARGRQKQTSFFRKTLWAVHDKRRFERLINSIHSSVQDLIELFPAPIVERMRQLSRVEASHLASANDAHLLERACGNDDEMLAEALKEESTRRGHFVSDWNVSGNARVRIRDDNMSGSQSTAHTATRFIVSDSSDVWIGNKNQSRHE